MIESWCWGIWRRGDDAIVPPGHMGGDYKPWGIRSGWGAMAYASLVVQLTEIANEDGHVVHITLADEQKPASRLASALRRRRGHE